MSEDESRLDVGSVVAGSFSLLGQNIVLFGAMALGVGVLGGLADTFLGRGGSFIGNIVLFFVSVYAVHQALRLRLGHDGTTTPPLGRAFGMSFVSGLGILLGIILFIVPGVMLFVRWAVALPAMLREDLGIGASLERSRDLTLGHRWKILALVLLLWVPFLLVMLLLGGLISAFGGETAVESLPFNIFVNAAGAGITIVSGLCWTEVYARLSGEERSGALAEIFA